MGEVYRARDTKLNRDVALKVLPESIATDPDRLARFHREAQVLASLNHPNIAHIYGFDSEPLRRPVLDTRERSGPSASGVEVGPHASYLVMELVEGPTLADMLAGSGLRASGSGPVTAATPSEVRGAKPEARALPVADALKIARQLAEALETAHEQGIVHRDLKPANIKVRPDGTVKVLDFGLAKLAERPAEAGRYDGGVTASPTLTSPALMTGTGLILGTAAYMAPEQAAGKIVDRRADIWSFGVVLWEMLTGRRLFDGETVSHTLADVLRAPIDFDALPARTPRAITELVKRCLDRDVTTRLRDIGEARIAIQRQIAGGVDEPSAVSATPPVARGSSRAAWIAATVAAVVALAFAGTAFVHLREAPAAAAVLNVSLLPPDTLEFAFDGSLALPALSPDGTQVVFGAKGADGKIALYVRRLDSNAAKLLPGSENATFPFWSPDSRWVAFSQGAHGGAGRNPAKLRKVDVHGGSAVDVTDLENALRGGSWNRDGVIIFSTNTASPTIMRVAASGGAATPAIPAEQLLPNGQGNPVYPRFLPDGRHFLYTARQAGDIPIRVASIDEPGTPGKVIGQAHSNVEYADGHLLYLRGNTLVAQPFDLTRLATSGEAVPLAEGVPTFITPSRAALFTASDTGSLVFRAGTGDHVLLVWRDRAGKELQAIGELAPNAGVPRAASSLALSPDGHRLAVEINQNPYGANSNPDIWIFDLATGVPTRFTFSASREMGPIWSADGNTIFYSTTVENGGTALYRKAANGSSSEEVVLNDSMANIVRSVSPDGKWLLYMRTDPRDPKAVRGIWLLSLSGPKPESQKFLQADYNLQEGTFSPDGKWVAYVSYETGIAEIYVTPFPGHGGKRQVSSGGGISPTWRRDGHELFYVAPRLSLGTSAATGQLMAAAVNEENGTLDVGRPQALFDGVTSLNGGFANAADGQKFVLVKNTATAATPSLTLLQNWTAALKR